jgi:hypothetical protein
VGTPEAFAAAFLTAAETGMLGVESPDYTEDLRTRRIGRAMRAAGVHEVEILGGGSFGMAGATQDGRVVKLTTDESEVEAGSVLRGQHLPHVVHIDGSWFVRRTRVVKWNTGVEHRVGMLLMERVEPVGAAPDGNAVTILWSKIRETYNATPWKLVKMSRADARATLYAASTALERQLRDVGSKLAVEVADGLHELRDHRVYGIDVHAGNIGFHRRDGVYKLFDIGSSSSPDTANPGELPLETETAPRGMTEEGVQVEEIGGEGPRQAELVLTPEQIETARDIKAVGFIQMPPTRFLQLTSLMLSGSGNVNSYDEIMRTAAPLAEYNARPARVPPYLSVDVATGQVLEHEGRHRAAAVKKAGGNVVPIAIRLMRVEGRSESVISPRTGIRLKDMPRTLLDENGQGYRVPISLDGAIDLYGSATRTASEAHHERSRIVRGETTGFYHGSWNDLPVGTVLQGNYNVQRPDHPIEKLVEALRPTSQVSHYDSVFMVRDIKLLKDAGGGGDGPFTYEVEPIGHVSGPFDGAWFGEIADKTFDVWDQQNGRQVPRRRSHEARRVREDGDQVLGR